MRLSIPCIILITSLCVTQCSKNNKPSLTGAAALLTGKPWKLQQTDTIYYDTAYQQTGQQTIVITDCQHRPNWIFYANMSMQSYIGCDQPAAEAAPGWSWAISQEKYLSVLASGSTASGPIYQYTDSIITLTRDSLVLAFKARPRIPYSPVTTDRPLLIHDWYTH